MARHSGLEDRNVDQECFTFLSSTGWGGFAARWGTQAGHIWGRSGLRSRPGRRGVEKWLPCHFSTWKFRYAKLPELVTAGIHAGPPYRATARKCAPLTLFPKRYPRCGARGATFSVKPCSMFRTLEMRAPDAFFKMKADGENYNIKFFPVCGIIRGKGKIFLFFIKNLRFCLRSHLDILKPSIS
jgi:hypothetical protein